MFKFTTISVEQRDAIEILSSIGRMRSMR